MTKIQPSIPATDPRNDSSIFLRREIFFKLREEELEKNIRVGVQAYENEEKVGSTQSGRGNVLRFDDRITSRLVCLKERSGFSSTVEFEVSRFDRFVFPLI